MISQKIHSTKDLPIKDLPSEESLLLVSTDANAGASEGYLGQRIVPDAVSGASAI